MRNLNENKPSKKTTTPNEAIKSNGDNTKRPTEVEDCFNKNVKLFELLKGQFERQKDDWEKLDRKILTIFTISSAAIGLFLSLKSSIVAIVPFFITFIIPIFAIYPKPYQYFPRNDLVLYLIKIYNDKELLSNIFDDEYIAKLNEPFNQNESEIESKSKVLRLLIILFVIEVTISTALYLLINLFKIIKLPF